MKSLFSLFRSDSELCTKLKCAFGISDKKHEEIVEDVFCNYRHNDFEKVKGKHPYSSCYRMRVLSQDVLFGIMYLFWMAASNFK